MHGSYSSKGTNCDNRAADAMQVAPKLPLATAHVQLTIANGDLSAATGPSLGRSTLATITARYTLDVPRAFNIVICNRSY
jgi:hypothetical protein